MILDVIVLTLISLLGYTWVGYPVLLTIVSKRKAESGKQKAETGPDPDTPLPPHSLTSLPPISIILAAQNEEGVIGARLENLVDVIGDRDVQVYVGLDGCIDDTAKAAGEVAKHHDNIHVCDFEQRRGKVAVLKELVRKAKERVNYETRETHESKLHESIAKQSQPDSCKVCQKGDELQKENPDTLILPYSDTLAPLSSANSAPLRETSPILVFTDANTHFKADALDKLLAPFDDPTIGGVCGRLVFLESGNHPVPPHLEALSPLSREERVNYEIRKIHESAESHDDESSADFCNVCNKKDKKDNSATQQLDNLQSSVAVEGCYWRWETKLKTAESRLDSCLGANGAIYAVREELFWSDIPDNTVVDDFVIGMKVREQGLRMIYEPSAVAEEELPELSNEWGRRIRIGSGDYQALALCSRCLSSRYGKFAWSFWSHKVLRWLTPHMLLLLISGFWLLVGSGWLFYDQNGYFRSTFSVALGMAGSGMTAVFILSALLGSMLRDGGSKFAAPFKLCDHFMTMQAALFVGFIRYCRGDLKGFWTRTPR